jgi:hypothetical protein
MSGYKVCQLGELGAPLVNATAPADSSQSGGMPRTKSSAITWTAGRWRSFWIARHPRALDWLGRPDGKNNICTTPKWR